MVVTIVAILMIMAGYFLILYSAVALIQEKRFYTSAPEEVQAVIPEREERTELFPGARSCSGSTGGSTSGTSSSASLSAWCWHCYVLGLGG